jgi:hypothetical protein
MAEKLMSDKNKGFGKNLSWSNSNCCLWIRGVTEVNNEKISRDVPISRSRSEPGGTLQIHVHIINPKLIYSIFTSKYSNWRLTCTARNKRIFRSVIVAVEVSVLWNMWKTGLCILSTHSTHHQAQFCLETKTIRSDKNQGLMSRPESK